jgi:hypothetical protein
VREELEKVRRDDIDRLGNRTALLPDRDPAPVSDTDVPLIPVIAELLMNNIDVPLIPTIAE